jgi:hypothetical protein
MLPVGANKPSGWTTSARWLFSSGLSSVQDVFLNEPVSILAKSFADVFFGSIMAAIAQQLPSWA